MERSLVRTGSESGRNFSEEVIRLYIIHSEREGETGRGSPSPDRYRPGYPSGRPCGRTTQVAFNSAHTVKLVEKMVRDFVCYLNYSLTQI